MTVGAGEALGEQVDHLRTLRSSVIRIAIWSWAGFFLAVIALVIGFVQLNQHTERKFCDVLISVSSSFPPTTARGADTASRVEQLYRELGCPKVVKK
jgi:hypothetical protein